ncbi:conserved hypothetical protein [Haloarcula hispanica ATCC 33960]|uniref:Uncharacterized protein n=1 Tax=Haloarcula hispanica (strain ATCC 33960 / DSM 4426 / JCM 8911 / NBRC 102182 / NCIMB 2187 / VKM B-1755) TaxID=634497 RepID=G0HV09_HALHT|nr:conserved hypothetical protein [Haloarcula hispanica ATCC 33960]
MSHSTRHGVVSLLGGFVAGYLLFIAIGSSPGDALFSALTLAVLVAAWRVLTQPSL